MHLVPLHPRHSGLFSPVDCSTYFRVCPKFVHGDFGSGLEEAFILLYLLVDDAYRRVTFGGRLRQRGPEPKLSDVEVLTMEIFGEQQGRHDDAAIGTSTGISGTSFRTSGPTKGHDKNCA
jgi:hypothetical protein